MGCCQPNVAVQSSNNDQIITPNVEISNVNHDNTKQTGIKIESICDFEIETEIGIDDFPEVVPISDDRMPDDFPAVDIVISRPVPVRPTIENGTQTENSLQIPLPKGFICVAVGGIEGNDSKLEAILSLIYAHPNFTFVFLGDLVDNISTNIKHNKNFKQNFHCIELLEKFFIRSGSEVDFKSPSDAFRKISFRPDELKLSGNVQFIVGNAEVDILNDLQQSCIENNDKYIFGKGKYQKKFTIEQIRLIYRYLASCSSELTCKKDNKTIHFRHALKINFETHPSDTFVEASARCPVVCGHTHKFGTETVKSKEEITAVVLDTSPNAWDARCGVVAMENGRLEAFMMSPLILVPRLE